jgi:enoyl-CoA hydratase/carnithine racemase
MGAAIMGTVLTERVGQVGVITINRPERHNAIDPETSFKVDEALNEMEADADIAAVVLTGAGDKAFCTGMDLKHAAQNGVHGVMVLERGFCGLTSRVLYRKPLIAAVNGFAMAGGFELALACDLIIASENASFALPEVKRGLFAGAGGILRLTRRSPGNLALEVIMTGDATPADRALSMGIINRMTPVGEARDAAVALAQRICENAPISVRISRELSYAGLDLSYDEAVRFGGELGKEMLASEDRLEGVRAFAEGRKPVWKGR